jgi:hypothetical protein
MAIKELVHGFQIGLEVRSRRLNKTSEKCARREYNTRSRVLFAVADRVERTERGLANQMTADRTMANAYVDTVLHEVKERAVVDKPITKAEVVALLEASHRLPTKL